jgi:hypothetical protein
MKRESAIFWAASGVIALHVIDDNFVQPQPGTSAFDHLVSGLVPPAALVALAAIYGRRRAGVRASIAFTLGLLAIAAGVGEAGYYSVRVGPSGDDYTGLLLIPAGLLLVGVGAATLWTTRRRSDSFRRRYLRRALLTVGAAVTAYMVLFPFALSYAFTHSARAGVPAAKLGAPYEQVAFMTSDGLRLKGWYVPSQNGAAVIAFPGRRGPQRQARMLVRHGYGVLLFDRRGEGESEGDPLVFGWGGEKDVNAAVSFLQGRADVESDRIGGIGLSVGGEMILEAAAESDGLRAVVSEGAGARSIREDVSLPGLAKWFDLPSALAVTTGTIIYSNQLPPPSLKSLVPRIAPRPLFLIYATHGQGGEVELSPQYYAAAGEPKTLWAMTDASHTGGITARPQEYERRVVAFFDHALQP